jgi:cyclic nucleotide gated channel
MADTSSDNLYLQVVGACWYFLAVDRQVTCWRYNCQNEVNISCNDAFFDCRSLDPLDALAANRSSWNMSSNITTNCDNIASSNPFFNYGIYTNAISNGITTSNTKFMVKYFYCVWTGLLSLSSLAQTFAVSTYIWEIVFTICIIILGLLLFAFLIGNMQVSYKSLLCAS